MRLWIALALLTAPAPAQEAASADEAALTLSAPAADAPALLKTPDAAADAPVLKGAKAGALAAGGSGLEKRPEASDEDRIRPEAAAAAAREDGRPRKGRAAGVKARKGGRLR